MKKVVLAAAFLLVAFTGNSSLKGSILVNTISFADLPDKPSRQTTTVVASSANINTFGSFCPGQVKTPVTTNCIFNPTKTCVSSTSRE